MKEIDGLPKVKRYRKGDPLEVEAEQIWVILTSCVMEQQHATKRWDRVVDFFVTYEELIEMMGRPFRMNVLRIVAEYCKMVNLPILPMLLVNPVTRTPSDLVVDITREGKTFLDEQREATEFDWMTIRIPKTGMLEKAMSSSNFDHSKHEHELYVYPEDGNHGKENTQD